MQERLQKVLARAGVASRRRAEELIKQGKVRVDGRVVTEMGVKVDPEIQAIECDGITLSAQEEKIYLLLPAVWPPLHRSALCAPLRT